VLKVDFYYRARVFDQVFLDFRDFYRGGRGGVLDLTLYVVFLVCEPFLVVSDLVEGVQVKVVSVE
jgi:hypothetical protein